MAGVGLSPSAAAATPAQDAFVGSYVGSTVDSVQQLAILPDNTFCYALMAGTLDMMIAGRWQASAANPAVIELRQAKAAGGLLPVWGTPGAGDSLRIRFNGRALSSAPSVLFATSDSPAPPKQLRLLFGQSHSAWESEYVLPPVARGQAHYFFIGVVREDERTGQMLTTLERYDTRTLAQLDVSYDEVQDMPRYDISATLRDSHLLIGALGDVPDSAEFGERRPLAAEEIATIQTRCITPAFAAEKGEAVAGPSEDPSETTRMVPHPLPQRVLHEGDVVVEPVFRR